MNPTSAAASVVLLAALSLASHAHGTAPTQSLAAGGARAEFITIDRHKRNLVRVDPTANWGSYKQIRFEPVAYEPSNPDRRLDPHEALRITEKFDASLHSKFRGVRALKAQSFK